MNENEKIKKKKEKKKKKAHLSVIHPLHIDPPSPRHRPPGFDAINRRGIGNESDPRRAPNIRTNNNRSRVRRRRSCHPLMVLLPVWIPLLLFPYSLVLPICRRPNSLRGRYLRRRRTSKPSECRRCEVLLLRLQCRSHTRTLVVAVAVAVTVAGVVVVVCEGGQKQRRKGRFTASRLNDRRRDLWVWI